MENTASLSLDDYIGSDAFKLFKLHGSVNWGREVETPIPAEREPQADPAPLAVAVARELIDRAPELKVSNRFRLLQQLPIGLLDGAPLLAALAIPVETKSTFECPDNHLESLRAHLPRVHKLILIGWRGAEMHFIELMKGSLTSNIPMQVVAGNLESATEILQRVRNAGMPVAGEAREEGFSEYVVKREAERFLAT